MKYRMQSFEVLLATVVAIGVVSPSLADTVAYYRFETGGLLTDSSGNGRHLTTNTGNQALDDNPFGASFPNPIPNTGANNASVLDNVASNAGLLSAPDDDGWTNDIFTVEAFVHPLNLPGGTGVIAGQQDSSVDPGQRGWFIGVRPDGGFRTYVSGDGENATSRTNFVGFIEAGKTYYIATQYQIGNGIGPGGQNVVGRSYIQNISDGGPLFIDAFTATASEITSLHNSSAPLTIGSAGSNGGGAYFDGFIDEIRISNTYLDYQNLLAHDSSTIVKPEFAISGQVIDVDTDGTIQSVTVNILGEDTVYSPSDLSNASLTAFGGKQGTGVAHLIGPPGETSPPDMGTRADFFSDERADTGYINLDNWSASFADDIENRLGPDILLLDWGSADTVDITINGITLDDVSPTSTGFFQGSMAERTRSISTDPATTLAALETVPLDLEMTFDEELQQDVPLLTSGNNNAYAIDLSDFGFANGAFLTAGMELSFSDGQGIDPMALLGLLTPPDALAGDFNNDGTVSLADYTVWRDNLGGDEAALNGAGDGLGVVDADDYAVWKANFGSTSAPGALVQTVPEPGTLVLLLSATCFLAAANARRSKS